MLIISHVCAEFHDAKGTAVFSIPPSMINNTFINAPDFIQEDPLFRMLVQDGSIETSITEERKRSLENDPTEGLDAAGKAIHLPEKEEEIARKAVKSAKGSKSAEPKQETATADPAKEPAAKESAAKEPVVKEPVAKESAAKA